MRSSPKEVTRDHMPRPRAEELPPRLAAPRGGIEPGAVEDLPDRRRGDRMAETDELAVDTPVTPGRILRRDPHDQCPEPRADRRAVPTSLRIRPVPGDKTAMPAQQGRRRNEERGRPPLPVEHPTEPREHHAIAVVETRPWVLAAKHRELVAQHEDLDIFGTLPPTTQD